MRSYGLRAPDLEWHGIALRRTRYKPAPALGAPLCDDGIIDDVAIERVSHGTPPAVRLTGRELYCVVWTLAHAGVTDEEIAIRLGDKRPRARDEVRKYRNRYRIPAFGRQSDEYIAGLIAYPQWRDRASTDALAAAGVTAA